MARSTKDLLSRIGIGADSSGRLTGEGRMEVLGTFRGDLDWSGTITIGPGATSELRGRAERVEVHGTLKGDVEAGTAFVSKQGAWSGKGTVGEMATEDGARVEGEFRFGTATASPEAPPIEL